MTLTQKKILWHMQERGQIFAASHGQGSRKLGFGIFNAQQGGLLFRVYGSPLYFMIHKPNDWFERAERNVPGVWYRLTPKGQEAALEVKDPYRHNRSGR